MSQPAEPPSLDSLSSQAQYALGGPSVINVDDAVSAIADSIDWNRLRHFSLPGVPTSRIAAPKPTRFLEVRESAGSLSQPGRLGDLQTKGCQPRPIKPLEQVD